MDLRGRSDRSRACGIFSPKLEMTMNKDGNSTSSTAPSARSYPDAEVGTVNTKGDLVYVFAVVTKADLVYVFMVFVLCAVFDFAGIRGTWFSFGLIALVVIPSMVSRIIKRAKALLSSSREKERHKALAKEIALWMKEKEASPE